MQEPELPSGAIRCFDLRGPCRKRLAALTYRSQGGLVGVRTASYPDEMQIWDVDKLALRHELQSRNKMEAAFSPEGNLLATVGEEGASLWDPTTGQEIRRMAAQPNSNVVVFSPNGRLLATSAPRADDDHPEAVVEIWDPHQGTLVQSFTGKAHYCMSLAFSPDGRRIAAGGGIYDWDTRLFVWDLAGGKLLDLDPEHTVSVYAIAFSPDGQVIATGSNAVHFWDAVSGPALSEKT